MSSTPGAPPAKSPDVSGSADAEVAAGDRRELSEDPGLQDSEAAAGVVNIEDFSGQRDVTGEQGGAANEILPLTAPASDDAMEVLSSPAIAAEVVEGTTERRPSADEAGDEDSDLDTQASVPIDIDDGNELGARQGEDETSGGTSDPVERLETAGAGELGEDAQPEEEIEDVSGLIIEGETMNEEALAAEGAGSEQAQVSAENASAPGPMDDEEFLRRVVLPTPPPFRADILTSAGALPGGRYPGPEGSDERTVISQPPSPEMLAALAGHPPQPSAGTPAAAPFASWPEPKRGVHLAGWQLVSLLVIAAIGGGAVVHYAEPPVTRFVTMFTGGATTTTPLGAEPAAVAPAAPAVQPAPGIQPVAVPPPAAPAAQAAPPVVTSAPAASAPAVTATATTTVKGAPAPAPTPAAPAAAATAAARAPVARVAPPAGTRTAAAAPSGTVRTARAGVGRRTTSVPKRAAAARKPARPKKAFVDPFE